MKPRIAIAMGSDSDWAIMKRAQDLCLEFGVATHVQVISAHRTPEDLPLFCQECEEKEISVIIAGAGGAAHLPGMLASFTTLPVIGVPVNITALQGIDSLLSIVQMPKGIPVATVAIDNSDNAALLALRILGAHDTGIREKLKEHQVKMKSESRSKTQKLFK